MFMITRLTLATVTLLGSVALAGAQTTAPTAPMPSPGGAAGTMPMMGKGKMMGGDMSQMMPMLQGDGMGMTPFDHIEGRIAFYKAELGITDAQMPQWNALADALRSSAKGMRTAMASMIQAGMPTTAPARMEAMVQIMSARLDAMKATVAAEKSLYAVLSDDQKKTADELIGRHLMGMRGQR